MVRVEGTGGFLDQLKNKLLPPKDESLVNLGRFEIKRGQRVVLGRNPSDSSADKEARRIKLQTAHHGLSRAALQIKLDQQGVLSAMNLSGKNHVDVVYMGATGKWDRHPLPAGIVQNIQDTHSIFEITDLHDIVYRLNSASVSGNPNRPDKLGYRLEINPKPLT